MKTKLNYKKSNNEISAIILGLGIFFIYFDTFFKDFLNFNYKMETLLAVIFAILGAGVGKFLYKKSLKMSNKKRKYFILAIIIFVIVTSVVGFTLT